MFDITLMKKEMQDVLEKNILNFWMTQMVDEQHGGFYGRIDGQGVLHPEAEKGAILNARILWSFSAAYRVLTEEREYLAMATRAKNYFIEHFIDKEYGGVYWQWAHRGPHPPCSTPHRFPGRDRHRKGRSYPEGSATHRHR